MIYEKGKRMFSYNKNTKESRVYINLPPEIKYNFEFLNDITGLIKIIEDSGCDAVLFSYNEKNAKLNKMGAAYLYTLMRFFSQRKKVYVNQWLLNLIRKKVSHKNGKKFEKIELKEIITNPTLQCYSYDSDTNVTHTVEMIVEFITEKSLVFENVKEFLITTIGEVFSNAFYHGNENLVHFMYDIEKQKENYHLVINITDYGKTIIGNVQDYLNESLDHKECMKWAMQSGNTTREGSGGYGLPTLIDYVKQINGELLIFSSDCIYALKGNAENILYSKGMFSGTSFSMKIPLFDTSKIISYDEKKHEIISISLDEI